MLKRYENKPFLLLLDSLVLYAIGELSDEDFDRLVKMVPSLQKTYNIKNDNWYDIVLEVMDFEENILNVINECWIKNQQIAFKSGETLLPNDFAYMFVDANFQ